MNPIPQPGSLFVVSAPSGAGKTSLVRALLGEQSNLRLSVSCTTRAPRPGELDGIDYEFLDRDEFIRRRDAGEFLEWAQVHANLYATSRAWIEARIAAGEDVVLEIDWQGAMQVQRAFPQAVLVFIAPPSIEALRQRLESRGLDSPAVIEQRIQAARPELAEAGRFEYVIINQEFAGALRQLAAVVEASRCRFAQQRIRYRDLFDGFGIDEARALPE